MKYLKTYKLFEEKGWWISEYKDPCIEILSDLEDKLPLSKIFKYDPILWLRLISNQVGSDFGPVDYAAYDPHVRLGQFGMYGIVYDIDQADRDNGIGPYLSKKDELAWANSDHSQRFLIVLKTWAKGENKHRGANIDKNDIDLIYSCYLNGDFNDFKSERNQGFSNWYADNYCVLKSINIGSSFTPCHIDGFLKCPPNQFDIQFSDIDEARMRYVGDFKKPSPGGPWPDWTPEWIDVK
jgi:hypothetical protein